MKLDTQISGVTSVLSPDLAEVQEENQDSPKKDEYPEGDEEETEKTPREKFFEDFNDEVKRYRALKKQMKKMQAEEQAILALE